MMGQPASLQGHTPLIAKDTCAHHAITQSPWQIIKAIAYLPTLRKNWGVQCYGTPCINHLYCRKSYKCIVNIAYVQFTVNVN